MKYTKEDLIQRLRNFVDNNGYPTSKRNDFKSKNGLPCARIYANTFGGDLSDWLEICGYKLSDEEKYIIQNRGRQSNLSKEDCIEMIYSMQNSLNRPLEYDDFRNPNQNSVGITEIRRYWNTMNNMKKELGLTVNQESMTDKQITKDVLDNDVNNILDYLQSENRAFITTREINNLGCCSRYLSLDRACRKYYNEKLIDRLNDFGICLGKQGRGFNYDFDDGEHTTSQYEYIFSKYLREYGFVYNKDYFRDVKYSEFISIYQGNMNCDYVIHYNERVIYIEIAGIIADYKQWYYQNRQITQSKSKDEYRVKLKQKEDLLKSKHLEYYLLFPCDLSKVTLSLILNSTDDEYTRQNIEHFNKHNLEWDKIIANGELKYDYNILGKDNMPQVVYA